MSYQYTYDPYSLGYVVEDRSNQRELVFEIYKIIQSSEVDSNYELDAEKHSSRLFTHKEIEEISSWLRTQRSVQEFVAAFKKVMDSEVLSDRYNLMLLENNFILDEEQILELASNEGDLTIKTKDVELLNLEFDFT